MQPALHFPAWLKVFTIAAIALLTTLPFSASAHDARPAVVEFEQTKNFQVRVKLQIPDAIDPRFRPAAVLPDDCEQQGASLLKGGQGGYSYRSTYQCERSLRGQTVGIEFPAFNPSLSSLFRLSFANGESFTKVLAPGSYRWAIPEEASFGGVASEYTWLGISHIWLGFDHLLFVICLLFIAGTTQRIIFTITGFTIAHSLTLGLSALGVVQFSVIAIEALIALSIVFLAVEILRGDKNSLAWRKPIIVACAFGLLHGLGFASVLAEIGLPQSHEIQALLFFNIGVEIGQILFITAILFAVKMLTAQLKRTNEAPFQTKAKTVTAYGIGIVSSYWFFERSLNVLI